MGVIILQGSCPWGNCPQGSCPSGSCPRGSCPRTVLRDFNLRRWSPLTDISR